MATEKTGYSLKVERGERPFLYSDEHRSWFEAARRKDDRAMNAADIAWRRRFKRGL